MPRNCATLLLPALALECGLIGTSVALRRPGQETIESVAPDKNSHNEDLALTVKALLDRSGLTPPELRGLVLGAGPGSFTGLRIGFSFAQGLSFALGIPVCTISSLRACAYPYSCEARFTAVMIDARRGERFAALYERKAQERLHTYFEDVILTEDEMQRRIRTVMDAASVLPQDLCVVTDFEPSSLWRECRQAKPRSVAAALIALVEEQGAESFDAGSAAMLKPNYVRAVAAKTIKERAAEHC